MCMDWLKYVTLNRKDRLKNMRALTLEVAMLADVSGAYSAISSVTLLVREKSSKNDMHMKYWRCLMHIIKCLGDVTWVS